MALVQDPWRYLQWSKQKVLAVVHRTQHPPLAKTLDFMPAQASLDKDPETIATCVIRINHLSAPTCKLGSVGQSVAYNDPVVL